MRMSTVLLLLVGTAFVCRAAWSEERGSIERRSDISALQEQRVKLLEQRVAIIEEHVEMGLTDRSHVIQSQIDLINARLDYAQTKDERRTLLTDLMGKYDQQIKFVEQMTRAPATPPQAGQRPSVHHVDAISKLLYLKSERIRVQILRDTL